MSVLHYAAPYQPPVLPGVGEWARAKHTWTGWDGAVWEISDPSTGVFLTQGGVRGLHLPPHNRYTKDSPALHGTRHQGSRVLERECFWPLYVYSDAGSAGWVELDRAFWSSMHRDKPGVWRVEVEGQARELSCRFMESEDGYARDPVYFGWSAYGVRLVAADDPFWRGEWVVRQFDNTTTATDFFGAGAPPFYITSSSQLASARIDNPGDEPSHLVYLLHGPFDSATVGIGDPGAVTEYVVPVPAGRSVVIDTRPVMPATARLIDTPTAAPGSDEWEAQVFDVPTESAFAGTGALALNSPLQPGQERPLSISMVGAGSVTVAHRPPHARAW